MSATEEKKVEKEKSVPKDAQVININWEIVIYKLKLLFQVMISILKDMGINDFEPRVVNQMLEFSYRFEFFDWFTY